MKLTALKTFRHGATLYRRGHDVEMSEAQAKPLIASKLVRADPQTPKRGRATKVELEKLTNKRLHELAGAEGIAVETDDNKAGLVEKIISGRVVRG